MTTLDLLDDLARREVLSPAQVYANRVWLRQAGYQLVPATTDEISYHLANAPVVNDRVAETAELRALRENLLRARMGKILQIPSELPWLQQTMGAVIGAIKRLWTGGMRSEEASIRSTALIHLIDIRGFAVSAISDNQESFARFAYAAQLLQLTSPPDHASAEIRVAYFDWLDGTLLASVKESSPETGSSLFHVGRWRALGFDMGFL